LDNAQIKYKITETYRSDSRQNKLYKQGRETSGAVVTNAQGGESYHNFGAAIDLYPLNSDGSINFDSSELILFGFAQIAKRYKIEWGGSWKSLKDYGHFQVPRSEISLTELQTKYPLK